MMSLTSIKVAANKETTESGIPNENVEAII
jgi:hypothetical protein